MSRLFSIIDLSTSRSTLLFLLDMLLYKHSGTHH